MREVLAVHLVGDPLNVIKPESVVTRTNKPAAAGEASVDPLNAIVPSF